jgi:hypothetical protein
VGEKNLLLPALGTSPAHNASPCACTKPTPAALALFVCAACHPRLTCRASHASPASPEGASSGGSPASTSDVSNDSLGRSFNVRVHKWVCERMEAPRCGQARSPVSMRRHRMNVLNFNGIYGLVVFFGVHGIPYRYDYRKYMHET